MFHGCSLPILPLESLESRGQELCKNPWSYCRWTQHQANNFAVHQHVLFCKTAYRAAYMAYRAAWLCKALRSARRRLKRWCSQGI